MSSSFFDAFVSVQRSPILAIGCPLALGTASGLITKTSVNSWYAEQEKPPGLPPRAAFPVAWTCLYAGMGYAAHKLVTAWDRSPYLAERRDARSALILYGVQFALNLVWTPLFFGANKPVPALVDVVALTLTNYRITALAFGVDKTAGAIFLAYSAWTTFATYLNGGIVYLNRGKRGDSSSSKQA